MYPYIFTWLVYALLCVLFPTLISMDTVIALMGIGLVAWLLNSTRNTVQARKPAPRPKKGRNKKARNKKASVDKDGIPDDPYLPVRKSLERAAYTTPSYKRPVSAGTLAQVTLWGDVEPVGRPNRPEAPRRIATSAAPPPEWNNLPPLEEY